MRQFLGEKMLKSCCYCGKIHNKSFNCGNKPQKKYIRNKEIDRFRNTQLWQNKREYIKKRDKYLCQACLNNLKGTMKKINNEKLSVHHIKPLRTHYELRLTDSNLITLCDFHHEQAEDGRLSESQLYEIIPPSD